VSGSLDRLFSTVSAAREMMVKRLAAESLAPEERRDMEMALKELDAMWGELSGEAAILERENQRYAEFFEFAPDACLITDVAGSVREANQAALELLGVTRAELVGRSLNDHVAALKLELRVRPIALKESDVSGLCWLIREAAMSDEAFATDALSRPESS